MFLSLQYACHLCVGVCACVWAGWYVFVSVICMPLVCVCFCMTYYHLHLQHLPCPLSLTSLPVPPSLPTSCPSLIPPPPPTPPSLTSWVVYPGNSVKYCFYHHYYHHHIFFPYNSLYNERGFWFFCFVATGLQTIMDRPLHFIILFVRSVGNWLFHSNTVCNFCS